MTEEKKELTRTTIKDQKVLLGEKEFTNLIKTLIHVYQFRSNNLNPIAVVIPDIKEVNGIKVEFPTETIENVQEG